MSNPATGAERPKPTIDVATPKPGDVYTRRATGSRVLVERVVDGWVYAHRINDNGVVNRLGYFTICGVEIFAKNYREGGAA